MKYCQFMCVFPELLFNKLHHFFPTDLMKIFMLNQNGFKDMILMKYGDCFISRYVIFIRIFLHRPDRKHLNI